MVKFQSMLMMVASFSCVIHCVCLPILIVSAPLLGGFLENEWIEFCLLIGSIFIGAMIIYQGYLNHKKMGASLVFIAGALLWILHAIFEHRGVEDGKLSLYIGTVFVLVSYILSHQQRRLIETDQS